MKTYRHLYDQITDFATLLDAFRKARRGKRNRQEVAAFEFDLETNLIQLQEELRNRTYQPGAYRNFYIMERKLRLTRAPALRSGARAGVSAAPFRDRVVHHALCSTLDPIWERRFIHDTYACRPGKGTHRALDRCQEFARRYPYVLQCDVHQFFPAVDHAILRAKLARYVADPNALWLIDRILASGAGVLAPMYEMEWFPGDDPSTGSGQGLLAADRPFLGLRVFSTHRRLRADNVQLARRRLRRNRDAFQAGRMSAEQFRQSLKAWIAHARHADSYRLRRALLSDIVIRPVPS